MEAALTQSINLYQSDGHGWRGSFKPRTMGLALLAILCGIALLSVYAWVRERRFESVVAQVVSADDGRRARLARAAELMQDAGQLGRLQQEVRALEQRNARLKVVLRSLGDPKLGHADGYSKQLAAVANATVEGVWVSHIDISGSSGRLSLRGSAQRAEQLPEYLQSLDLQPELNSAGVGSFALESNRDTTADVAGLLSFTMTQQERATAP